MSVRDDAALLVQKPVVAMLAKYKDRIASVVPKFMDDTRVLKLISGEIQRNPKLLECSPISVLNCVVQAASLGVEIRQKSAYLVPLKDGRTGRMVCNLWLDYRSEIDLIKRSGDVKSINALVVYSKDVFEYEITERGIHMLHRPYKFRRLAEGGMAAVSQAERGQPIGAYMLAVLEDGTQIDYMSLDEIQARQKVSKNTGPDSPWVKSWDEMACKTVIHHGTKMLRQTPELVQAQELGERSERGEAPEYIIDVEPEDADMQAPFLIQGTSEDQERVAEQKIAEMKSSGSKAEAGASANSGEKTLAPERELTPEENRALDAKIIADDERRAQAAQQQQEKPTGAGRFGPRR